MAANTSHADVAHLSDATFQRFVDNAGPLKAQLKAGFPAFGPADAMAVSTPTLLVSGGRSPSHITAVTEALAELIPNAERLRIAGATHIMFASHPTQFNAGVLQFIGSHSVANR